MSNFLGFVNFHENIKNKKEILEKMIKANNKKINLSSYSFYMDKSIGFSSNNIVGKLNQPYMTSFHFNNYIILFNGILYNLDYMKKKFTSNNLHLDSSSPVEILLKSYILHGINILNYIKGSFSFVIFDFSRKSLLVVRDCLGIKSLYYTLYKNTFIFSSNPQNILFFPKINSIHELKASHYGIFDFEGLHIHHY